MGTITRNRTIRPSSRLVTSKSYKIDTKKVGKGDTLIVNIDHESKRFNKSFKFSGSNLSNRNSISFRVTDYGTRIDISWSGAHPIGIPGRKEKSSIPQVKQKDTKTVVSNKIRTGNQKLGLSPIADKSSKVLILGTMPGEDSLRKQEYYGHSRNLFWQLVENITNEKIPQDYKGKTKLLLQNKIAVWDVCMTCFRNGSLDSNIANETPNELISFISDHPTIKAIGFNGQKASKLFRKHFDKIPGIKMIPLPSSSPANTGISKDEKNIEWGKLRAYL
jgi:hypoxanthine-DNA glycosylase